MRILKYVISLFLVVLLFLLCAAFLTSNSVEVQVDILFIPVFDVRLGIILTAFFIVGGLLGMLASALTIVRLRAEKGRLQRRLQNTSKLISGYSN